MKQSIAILAALLASTSSSFAHRLEYSGYGYPFGNPYKLEETTANQREVERAKEA